MSLLGGPGSGSACERPGFEHHMGSGVSAKHRVRSQPQSPPGVVHTLDSKKKKMVLNNLTITHILRTNYQV